MIEAIIYIIIGIFLWSVIGIIIGLILLISKQQRMHIRDQLQRNPNHLVEAFCGMAIMGPLTLVLIGYYKIEQMCKNYDYKDDL